MYTHVFLRASERQWCLKAWGVKASLSTANLSVNAFYSSELHLDETLFLIKASHCRWHSFPQAHHSVKASCSLSSYRQKKKVHVYEQLVFQCLVHWLQGRWWSTEAAAFDRKPWHGWLQHVWVCKRAVCESVTVRMVKKLVKYEEHNKLWGRENVRMKIKRLIQLYLNQKMY